MAAAAAETDIVVNNAGYGLFGPIIESDMAAVKKQFETNVFGALAVCQVSVVLLTASPPRPPAPPGAPA